MSLLLEESDTSSGIEASAQAGGSAPRVVAETVASADSRSVPLLRVAVVMIAANVALLALQQSAFRLLAPIIGSSVETWSTVIGVFLAGIALGSFVGGRMADTGDPLRAVRRALIYGATATAAAPFVAEYLKHSTLLAACPLGLQILLSATAVCLPPGFALALVTPPAIRCLASRAEGAGAAAGMVFALGTLGSLAGNYLTGFVLIPQWEIPTIVRLTAALTFVAAGATYGVRSGDGHAVRGLAARAAFQPPAGYRVACLTVFVCSFVSGALESAAFRMLAPVIGVSVYLSTGIVGVVLAGIASGNYLGGLWADRAAQPRTLRACIALAALAVAAVVPLLNQVADGAALARLPMIPRILVYSFALFFVPSALLGTISPQVIRRLVTDVGSAGRISGRIYAWSTVGCIAGILGSGWFFIEWFGVRRLVVVCGLLLVPATLLVGDGSPAMRWKSRRRWAWAFVPLAAAMIAAAASPYDLETKYFSIVVLDGERDGRAVKRLVLDRLVHSEVDPLDPDWLGYPHERIQAEVLRGIVARRSPPVDRNRLLVIGGGGYTLPRWVEQRPELSTIDIDVVEIDPGVTEIARRKLGLNANGRIRSIHLDGRQFVKNAPQSNYDLIVQDAVNDFSVPYHLMTREYNLLVRCALRPGGIYLLTIIDSLADGPFLRAAVRTMQADFPEVRLLNHSSGIGPSERCVYVIAGFGGSLAAPTSAATAAEETAWFLERVPAHVVPPNVLSGILEQDGPRGIVLTDDFAPVDTLMGRTMLTRE